MAGNRIFAARALAQTRNRSLGPARFSDTCDWRELAESKLLERREMQAADVRCDIADRIHRRSIAVQVGVRKRTDAT